jgi:crotonobetainyl-CoA:carnitine CoA-transferase CaiB-like acyl-CoA transferase
LQHRSARVSWQIWELMSSKSNGPDGGDFARGYDGALNGLSAYFGWLNRGKRSIVLDLKRGEDRDTFGKFIALADIFIHIFFQTWLVAI